MRLNEDRIHSISSQIADQLIKGRVIHFEGMRPRLTALIGRVIMNDLKIEDEINKEVETMIESMKREVPRGSAEWNSIFFQKKEEVARRRNYII